MIQLNESLARTMLPRYVTFRNDSGPLELSEHVHIGIYVVKHNSDFVKAYNDTFLAKCDAGILFYYNVDNEDINVISMEFWEAVYDVHDDEIKHHIDNYDYTLVNPIHHIFHY